MEVGRERTVSRRVELVNLRDPAYDIWQTNWA